MERWTSPEPIPIQTIPIIGIEEVETICGQFSPGSIKDQDCIDGLNEFLGLNDLPIKPTKYRIGNDGDLVRRWHIERFLGTDPNSPPDIAIFTTNDPTEVIIGDLPYSREGWWALGPLNDTIEQAVRSGSAKIISLQPNVYYLLDGKTIHRAPEPTNDNLRMRGTWSR